VLVRRLRRRNDRPLLKTNDPAATLNGLLAAREPIYSEAHLVIVSRDVPHEVIVEEIVMALCGKLGVDGACCRKDQP
jgi:shikimate kinase